MGSQRTNPNGCHNCRQKRLRCDGSVPSCRKCISLGKECLGYGNLWRWTDSVASRGKLAGKKMPLPKDTLDHCMESQSKPDATSLTVTTANQNMSSGSSRDLDLSGSLQLCGNLTDPLFSDMSSTDHYYLSYCLSPPVGLRTLFANQ
jgi:hypothetical protein